MFSFVAIAALLAVSINPAIADVNTCIEEEYTGQAIGFIHYDTWLSSTPEVATSSCVNHERFFSNNDDQFAALSYTAFEGSVACDTCVEVRSAGSNTSETLTVIETVNLGGAGDMQVPVSVVDRLAAGGAPVENGAVAITWRFIECPPRGNLQYRFSEGARADNSAGIMLSGSIVGVRSVELKKGNEYIELQRVSSSMFFALPSGTQSVPFELRVTSATYEKVQFRVLQIIDDGAEHDSGVAFTGACFPVPTLAPTPAPDRGQTPSGSTESGAVANHLSLFVGALFVLAVGLMPM